ncbi:TRAP transporter large permease [Ammoniphilus resinae]|uniref:Tripartite ATP-independent transporter DctM subunit n=1 Tax=Ammoniphilus resinae TaxID=861532 RepID=A0ABS4GVZ6_9BACL|nr:TRAP transporter large permease [Ammoniphilus resinae]MBP1934449.1 tripartite ATP-independent transporter DctM subunit [Ammoniphilus resinae]
MVGLSLGVLAVIVALGMPVAIAIAGATLLYYLTNDSVPTQLVFQAFVTGIESFPLLAIPFFILAGELMNAGGMTARLIRFAEAFVGHLTGGLAHVNVLTNTLMGGLSGSSNADAAAISKTLVPEMVKRGYDRAWSSALTAAGSIIGPIIPPGIGLILFGFLADVSIGKLFIGGILPGILLCLALMITVHITARKRGYKPSREKIASPKEMWDSFAKAFWALLLPVLIVGGIRFGVFTHTEAAAMAVVYALIVGFFIYRTMKLKDLAHVLASTVRITGVIMLIVAAASTFGRMLSWERIPHKAAEMMISFSSNPYVILFIITVSLLILGCFVEGTANLIIMTPLLMPIINQLGIDPVAFGVAMVLNLTIGGITPPLGTMMYTVSTLNGITTTAYTKQIWPFVIAVIVVLFILVYIPSITTFLPNLLME